MWRATELRGSSMTGGRLFRALAVAVAIVAPQIWAVAQPASLAQAAGIETVPAITEPDVTAAYTASHPLESAVEAPRQVWVPDYFQQRFLIFFYNAPATAVIYTLSLHDALPI